MIDNALRQCSVIGVPLLQAVASVALPPAHYTLRVAAMAANARIPAYEANRINVCLAVVRLVTYEYGEEESNSIRVPRGIWDIFKRSSWTNKFIINLSLEKQGSLRSPIIDLWVYDVVV